MGKIIHYTNSQEYKILQKKPKRKIHRILQNTKVSKQLPWLIDSSSINMSLHKFPKSTTSPFQYRQLFVNIKESLMDYKFLYADGSKLVFDTISQQKTEL